jgi:transposase-like protein
MARKRYKAEEIVGKLRQVDVLTSQGQSVAEAIRQIGVSEVTYYRWRQEFGGLKIEQVKRLRELELENSRLRKAISDLTLDKLIPGLDRQEHAAALARGLGRAPARRYQRPRRGGNQSCLSRCAGGEAGVQYHARAIFRLCLQVRLTVPRNLGRRTGANAKRLSKT